MALHFDSGDVAEIKFDQGVGYWWTKFNSGQHKFDFDSSVTNQASQLAEKSSACEVTNSADWPTDITLHFKN